jgi:hypothetical protein
MGNRAAERVHLLVLHRAKRETLLLPGDGKDPAQTRAWGVCASNLALISRGASGGAILFELDERLRRNTEPPVYLARLGDYC